MTSISVYGGTQAVTPLAVQGYQAQRQTRNVFQQPIGYGAEDVYLIPPTPRTGTLSMVFQTEADASTCFTMHSKLNVLTFADPDTTTTGMYYVPAGNVTIEQDDEDLAGSGQIFRMWIVTSDYREVTPAAVTT